MTDEPLLQVGPRFASALARVNLFRNKQLDDIGEILCEAYDDVPEPEAVTEARKVLQRELPATLGPPESMTVHFHWRDREARGKGAWEALPGDGFGFVRYVEGFGLRMQFDCAGISACADMSLDMLKATLAREGFSIWPMVLQEGQPTWGPVVVDMSARIEELERQVAMHEAEEKVLRELIDEDNRGVRIGLKRVEHFELTNLGDVKQEGKTEP